MYQPWMASNSTVCSTAFQNSNKQNIKALDCWSLESTVTGGLPSQRASNEEISQTLCHFLPAPWTCSSAPPIAPWQISPCAACQCPPTPSRPRPTPLRPRRPPRPRPHAPLPLSPASAPQGYNSSETPTSMSCNTEPCSWTGEHKNVSIHYNDIIMGAIASQITSLPIVYSTVYSGADQRKHQSSASLAFVREISRTNGQ